MKKQLAAGLACYMLATTAQADVVIGNPMAVTCLLYTSPSPRDQRGSRMPSSA